MTARAPAPTLENMRYLVMLSLLAPAAHAKLMVKGAASYFSDKTGDGANSTRTAYNANFGYVTEKGWAFGLLYQSDAASGGDALTTTAYGPSFGYVTRKEIGIFAVATYLFAAKSNHAQTGWGYQLDYGYRFEVHRISYAMQVSYESLSVKATGGANTAISHVTPYFAVWFEI